MPLRRLGLAQAQQAIASTEVDPAADDVLLAAAARVQPEAFTFLYDRYAGQVYSYCYLRLGSREAAEDAMSEIFLKAFDDLDKFRGGVFAGWLFRIARYTVVDIYRRDRRRATLPLVSAEEVVDPGMALDERVADDSEVERLRAALRQLPADQRAVLELQLADLAPREIAATLGRSLNAVRLLRLRAIRGVRPLLEGESAASTRGELAC